MRPPIEHFDSSLQWFMKSSIVSRGDIVTGLAISPETANKVIVSDGSVGEETLDDTTDLDVMAFCT